MRSAISRSVHTHNQRVSKGVGTTPKSSSADWLIWQATLNLTPHCGCVFNIAMRKLKNHQPKDPQLFKSDMKKMRSAHKIRWIHFYEVATLGVPLFTVIKFDNRFLLLFRYPKQWAQKTLFLLWSGVFKKSRKSPFAIEDNNWSCADPLYERIC